ncbi:MAG: WecB/TagA/CpsF family glycosyltransferase [Lachnospiraceae bacterium]|nr:WecB/TagA/CpsF family glycosyltransferase [Lachnospiraceae bacterium]
MKKMNVLGIPLRDYTLRETLKKVDIFLAGGKMGTIALITMKGLIVAQDSPEIKEWMSSLDMTVAADADILRAADINYRGRIHDVENQLFISEFLKKLVRQKKTVYLMSQNTASLEKLEKELLSYEETLSIVGKAAVDDLEYDDDFVINDMNMKVPDVLISNLESPKRERFAKENQMKMNVRIWLMVRADRELHAQEKGSLKQIYDKFLQWWFRIKLNRYEEQENRKQDDET